MNQNCTPISLQPPIKGHIAQWPEDARLLDCIPITAAQEHPENSLNASASPKNRSPPEQASDFRPPFNIFIVRGFVLVFTEELKEGIELFLIASHSSAAEELNHNSALNVTG